MIQSEFQKKKEAQVISPTACGGTLVEPSWNIASGPPQTTPEPIWAETPKLSAVGEKRKPTQRRIDPACRWCASEGSLSALALSRPRWRPQLLSSLLCERLTGSMFDKVAYKPMGKTSPGFKSWANQQWNPGHVREPLDII